MSTEAMPPGEPLLRVRNLSTWFRTAPKFPLAKTRTVYAVDGVSFDIRRGATFGLVGESGCGKTTTGLSIMRLVEPTGGEIRFDGLDVRGLGAKELRKLRQRIQMIFQDPYSSLNPRNRAGDIVAAPLRIQKIGSSAEQSDRVAELFRFVGLRPEQQAAYPHQFSGGQRQRICIARALASKPDLIVCDEPVSALDAAIQAQILNLLIRLQTALNLTYLFISHDMAVVQHMCDEIGVMYLGKLVETADRRELFRRPLHPYTQALLAAVPRIHHGGGPKGGRLIGDPPSPLDPPPGCRFQTRCPIAEAACRREAPELIEAAPGHRVACRLLNSRV